MQKGKDTLSITSADIHDLRGQVTIIRMYAESLLGGSGGKLSKEQESAITEMHKASLSLGNSLQSWSDILHGKK